MNLYIENTYKVHNIKCLQSSFIFNNNGGGGGGLSYYKNYGYYKNKWLVPLVFFAAARKAPYS